MSSKNIKAPYECMELKEYKLSDFVPEFSEFRQFDDLSRFGCENIEDNLIRLEKRGKFILKIELRPAHHVNRITPLKMELMKEN
ncbi:hypothetical protein [uncultured Methanobrevibacter sp.]|uniref:hypothetical protein n=1 Tax=uncultured Methanobrevibacter sp. TaxID=253161 RepID=UPI0025DF56C3|nr:hypothetical protein [uncultured Methanobrevibacter sp.]